MLKKHKAKLIAWLIGDEPYIANLEIRGDLIIMKKDINVVGNCVFTNIHFMTEEYAKQNNLNFTYKDDE